MESDFKKEFARFRRFWSHQTKDIKQQAFSRSQCAVIHSEFQDSKIWFMQLNGFQLPYITELDRIQTELRIALNIAETNYRKEFSLLKNIKIWFGSLIGFHENHGISLPKFERK